MKKIIALTLLCISLFLSSCTWNLVSLKYENGVLFSERAGVEYCSAPINYEPVSVGEEYAYYKDSDMILYEIVGLDPKEWLTQEYIGSATTIFHSTDITLPTLEEMKASKIHVCIEDELTFAVTTIDDQEVIDSLVDLFVNGTHEEWPLINSYVTYSLKFYSEEYPYIYYNLIYGDFPEGKFIYDRTTKRSVRIDDLLIEYIS